MWRYLLVAMAGITVQWLVTSPGGAHLSDLFRQSFLSENQQPGARPPAPPETTATKESLSSGDVQADQVRRDTAVPLEPHSRELRCGEALSPSSVASTRGVEIFVRAAYEGRHDGLHTWRYRVQFHNKGETTVQMLTRHWVFVDASGKVDEVKA